MSHMKHYGGRRNEKKEKISLVDALSFQIMLDNGINKYMGFDRNFDGAGFTPYT